MFKFTGLKGQVRIDPQSETIFDDGNWRHHRWQTIFRDMERVLGRENFKVISIEEKVSIDDLYMSGHLDITVWIKGYGRIVIDIKGINDRGFTRILTEDTPVEKHVEQLMAYCEARGVYKGMLFYENKNDNRWRCYLIKWDQSIWEKVQNWASEVVTALEHEKLPKRDVECQSGTFLYDRCPYAKWCYGGKDHDEIKQATYHNFPGIEVAWRRGHEVEE